MNRHSFSWKNLILILIGICLLWGVWKRSPYIINRPSLDLQMNRSYDGLRIISIDPDSDLSTCGLKEKDVITSLDGHKVTNISQKNEVLYRKLPNDTLFIHYISFENIAGASVHEEADTFIILPEANLDTYKLRMYILWLATLGLLTAIAGLIFSDNERTIIYFWLSVSVLLVVSIYDIVVIKNLSVLLLSSINILAISFMPALLLHFYFSFLEGKAVRGCLLYSVYVLGIALFGALHGGYMYLWFNYASDKFGIFDRIVIPFLPVMMGLFLLIGFLILLNGKYNTKSKIVQERIKWMLWGTCLSLVPFFIFHFIFHFILHNSYTNIWIDLYFLPLLILPLTYSYAANKEKIKEVNPIISNILIYIILIVAFIGLFFLLIILLLKINTQLFINNPNLPLYIAILITFIFLHPLRILLKRLLDHLFFFNFYRRLETFQSLEKRLEHLIGLDEIMTFACDKLKEKLGTEKVGIMLLEVVKKRSFDSFKTTWKENYTKELEAILVRAGGPRHKILDLTSAAANVLRPEDLRALHNAGIALIAPLWVESAWLGIVILGNKFVDEPYFEEDIFMLNYFNKELAKALERARSHQKIVLKEKMTHEKSIVSIVQKELLSPKHYEDEQLLIEICQYTSDFKGEFYNYSIEELDKHEKELESDAPLNMNIASAENFVKCLGITPELAKAIINKRDEIGFFNSLGDLLDIEGDVIDPFKLRDWQSHLIAGKLDINKIDKYALNALSDIEGNIVNGILDYIEKKGRIDGLDELLEIKEIDAKMLSKLSEYLEVIPQKESKSDDKNKYPPLLSNIMFGKIPLKGEGLVSALPFFRIEGMLELLKGLGLPPEETLDAVSETLPEPIEDEKPAGLLIAQLRLPEYTIHLARENWPPPILFSKTNNICHQLHQEGMVKEEKGMQTYEAKLQEGDILIFYVPSIFELKNERNENYDINRLEGLIRRSSRVTSELTLCQRILKDIKDFTKGMQINENIYIMTITCKMIKDSEAKTKTKSTNEKNDDKHYYTTYQ